MTLERSYTCDLYTTGSRLHPPEAAPAAFWRRIQLDYRGGARSVLVYETEPGDPGEFGRLMRRLRRRAGQSGFTITVAGGGHV